MSTTTLSDSREVVERSLHDAILQELVDKGYTPNKQGKTTFVIDDVNQLTKTFTVTGNAVAKYAIGRKFNVIGSTGNNAEYTVASTPIFTTPDTDIVVVEVIPDPTVDGSISIYTYYDDKAGIAELATALKAVQTTKGFAVELFGVSSPSAKNQKNVPRIVIISNQTLPGALGGAPDRIYTPNNGDILAPDAFIAKIMPPQTSNFTYDICLISDTSQQSRVLSAVLALAIPKRGYVPFYNDSTKRFFVRQFSFRSMPDNIEGINEEVYMYEVQDIFETENVTAKTGIKPITEIKIDTNEGTVDKSTKFNDKIYE